jgi:hypothetical protein
LGIHLAISEQAGAAVIMYRKGKYPFGIYVIKRRTCQLPGFRNHS